MHSIVHLQGTLRYPVYAMQEHLRFENAFEEFSDELFRHAYLRLSERERARELVQETFLKTWEYLERGNSIGNMRAFLYQTLRNLIIDEYRKKKAVSLDEMLLDDDDERVEANVPRDETDAFESAMDRFDGARAFHALGTLPDPYREVLSHRFISGLTIGEISDIIGESENVVSVRIHRGLKKLRALLETV
jgi:RNA polymerase sigma-70 factor (ECF subfamily)